MQIKKNNVTEEWYFIILMQFYKCVYLSEIAANCADKISAIHRNNCTK